MSKCEKCGKNRVYLSCLCYDCHAKLFTLSERMLHFRFLLGTVFFIALAICGGLWRNWFFATMLLIFGEMGLAFMLFKNKKEVNE